ncbi:hypothetical protein [Secundilactobacillus muriivasis]
MQNIGVSDEMQQIKESAIEAQSEIDVARYKDQYTDSKAVNYWKSVVDSRQWDREVIRLKKNLDNLVGNLADTLNTNDVEKRADDMFLVAMQRAVNYKVINFDYVKRIVEHLRYNVQPTVNVFNVDPLTLPKPTFEELHPLSEQDKAINAMYQKQKQGRLSKVGSLMNYGGRIDYQFSDFKTPDEATKRVLMQGQAISNEFKHGHYVNAIFTGKTGRGKTMLAVAIMNDVNQNSVLQTDCLIVSMAMFEDLLMANLNDQRLDERATLEKRMIKADLVVWDDLGSDTSMRREIKEANETTQKAIFRIADARQWKANIITTNHNGDELDYMYNSKIISRLMTKKPEHVIDFNQLPDRRMN